MNLAPIQTFSEPVSFHTGLESSSAQHERYIGTSAKNDVEAVQAWLAIVAATKTTYDSYRKEAERLLLWARIERQKTLRELKHEDFLTFKRFLADPQPAERWVSGGGRLPEVPLSGEKPKGPAKYKRSDPRWRPFYGKLSPLSQKQALVVLNSLMTWLVTAGYLQGNPLALSRQRRAKTASKVTRYLTPGVWADVKEYINELPREFAVDKANYYRVRWLFSILYLGALRLSELGNATMNQFHVSHGRDGKERWWLTVMGKGSKERSIPVSIELMGELAQYRLANGLSARPHPAEATPVILPLRNTGSTLSRSALHVIVKSVFNGAAERVARQSPAEPVRVEMLRQASAHWLRHTAGSHMADNNVDLRTVRDNFGHANLTTTSLYLHKDDENRHDETVGAHSLHWGT